MPRRVAAVLLLTLAACSGRDRATETRKVEDTVRRSIEAENAGDVASFLKLWTDDGLRSYDAGTRDELQSGQVLKVLATDPGAVKDFQAFSRQTGHELVSHAEAAKEFIFFMKKK